MRAAASPLFGFGAVLPPVLLLLLVCSASAGPQSPLDLLPRLRSPPGTNVSIFASGLAL
jgi:hypothetical protein